MNAHLSIATTPVFARTGLVVSRQRLGVRVACHRLRRPDAHPIHRWFHFGRALTAKAAALPHALQDADAFTNAPFAGQATPS